MLVVASRRTARPCRMFGWTFAISMVFMRMSWRSWRIVRTGKPSSTVGSCRPSSKIVRRPISIATPWLTQDFKHGLGQRGDDPCPRKRRRLAWNSSGHGELVMCRQIRALRPPPLLLTMLMHLAKFAETALEKFTTPAVDRGESRRRKEPRGRSSAISLRVV